jgi:glucuronate isomerase
MDPKNFNLKMNYVNCKNLDEGWFDELYKKAKKLTRSDEIIPLLELHYQHDKGKDIPKEMNVVNALKALLSFGKLRKNFLYFQCLKKDDEQEIANFIVGIEPMLGDHLYLEKQNYPVDLDAPERTVQFSFQRVVGPKKKNITPLVIFNLMLRIMQEDELWIK